MPSTKNDFHQGCDMGLRSGCCWTEGLEGGEEIWLQWQMESAQGGCQMPSSICLFPFNLLLNRADQLEL